MSAHAPHANERRCEGRRAPANFPHLVILQRLLKVWSWVLVLGAGRPAMQAVAQSWTPRAETGVRRRRLSDSQLGRATGRGRLTSAGRALTMAMVPQHDAPRFAGGI